MDALAWRFRTAHAPGFDPEVDSGLRDENASEQKAARTNRISATLAPQ
jgi:hypothetical protein